MRRIRQWFHTGIVGQVLTCTVAGLTFGFFSRALMGTAHRRGMDAHRFNAGHGLRPYRHDPRGGSRTQPLSTLDSRPKVPGNDSITLSN